jgi:hypothetical protein
MPKPVYIICCESVVIDSFTGLPSYINVFDTLKIAITALPAVAGTLPEFSVMQNLRIRAAAVWMLEQDEEEKLNEEYEHGFLIHPPSRSAGPGLSPTVHFKFDKPFYRFDAVVQGPPFTEEGMCFVESRIRKKGAEEWKSQNYPLRIEVIRSPK